MHPSSIDARCPICHRRAPVDADTRALLPHEVGSRECSGVGLPLTRTRLTAADARDRREFVADLHRGRLNLGWRLHVLAFWAAPAAEIRRATAQLRAHGQGADPYLYEPERVEIFARQLGAEDPSALVALINAAADAADRPEAVCAILRTLPRP